jgi:hypothetical protein
LPYEARVLQISLLLSELIVATVAAGPGVEPESPQARIMTVILDQIPTQPITSLKWPLPSYPRLGRITQPFIDNTVDSRDWSRLAFDALA